MESERLKRQIDRLLNEAEEAISQLDWATVRARAQAVLVYDPDNVDALAFLTGAERALGREDPVQHAKTSQPPPSAHTQPTAEPTSFANGRYQVTRYLGEGGKKRAYLAHDTLLDRDVAFSIIKTERLDEASRIRVTREAQAMGRLGAHPHIVTVFDLGQEQGQPYIVTELMDGGDVEGVIESAPDRRLPVEQAIDIAIQVCRGLDFAHSKGIVHRDLKPGNVWLTTDPLRPPGHVIAKIGDFGLAVVLERSRLTQEGMMVGTVSYMPPEQAMGGEVTPQSDLYSLGAMLYEMVAGRPPFLGDDTVAIIGQHINTPPVAPTWHNQSCPRPLEALILRLLAKDPSERSKSAADVLTALEAVDVSQGGEPTERPDEEHALDSLAGGVFVGRQREMGELKAALEDSLSGRGRMVMLVGEPGIGKTRTAQELATYAGMRNAQVLWGRCHESRGAPPYWPWVQAIRAYVREREPERLRSEMGAGAADIAEIVSDVREQLPDLRPPPTLDDPERARFRLFDSISTLLKSASRSRPLVVILDNLHWADRPSLLLLEFLAQELADSRLLVIGTYRDADLSRQHPLSETLGNLTRERLFQRVLLRGLSHEDVGRFIEITAGIAPPVSLVRAVHTQTEGNPLFVTEVVRLLVQEGELTQERVEERESWEVRIPEGVREVIGLRLNRLSQRCNETLTVASVIGREFGLDQLRLLVEDTTEERLLETLDEALSARVIEEQPREVGRYQFSHALIRQTLEDELTTTRRVRLHAHIAEALEALYGDEAEAHAVELAYHFGEAEAVLGSKKLSRYAVAAGERALASYAYEEAFPRFQRALAAKEGQDMDAETASILFGLGRTQIATLDWDKALDCLGQAFDFYESHDVSKALSIAEYPYPALFAARMPDLMSRAIKLAAPETRQVGNLLSTYGLAVALGRGDYEEAREAFDEALSIAQREGDRSLQVRTLADAANTDGFSLRWQEAMDKSKQAIDLARPGDHPVPLMRARFWAALAAVLALGNPEEAKEHADSTLALAEDIRDRMWIARALESQVLVARLTGDWEAARDLAGRGLTAVPQDTGILVNRVLLEYEVGEFDSGREYSAELFGPMLDTFTAFSGVHSLLIAVVGLISGDTTNFENARAAAEKVLSSSSLAAVAELEARLALGLMAAQEGSGNDTENQYALLASPGRGMTPMISIDRALGLMTTSLDRLDVAALHFEDALTFCANAGYQPELAWTCYNYADLLRKRSRSGDHEKAVRLLDDSLAITRRLSMRPLMERVLQHKVDAQGILTSTRLQTSIEAVASSVQSERPDLRHHAAPDGTVTILFTDIEGSTAMTERLGDRRAQDVLRTHNYVVREQISVFGGFEVKSQGDGFMVAFSSARRALECAIAIQQGLAAHNDEHSEERIRVRIGLHTGEAIKEGEDFFGRCVILAARIASQAQGEQILVSSLLKALVEGSTEFEFGEAREVELKGLSGAHQVFDIRWRGED